MVLQHFNCHDRVQDNMDRVKRIWYLSPMRTAKVQASLRIRAVSPEPSLLAHTSSESRGTFRQKARSLAPLNGWACAVKICHDGVLEDTNSLDGAHIFTWEMNTQIAYHHKYKILAKDLRIFDHFCLHSKSVLRIYTRHCLLNGIFYSKLSKNEKLHQALYRMFVKKGCIVSSLRQRKQSTDHCL